MRTILYFRYIHKLNIPVGDNGIDDCCGIDAPPLEPPELIGGLGGSILQGALGNVANSLPMFDPINMTRQFQMHRTVNSTLSSNYRCPIS